QALANFFHDDGVDYRRLFSGVDLWRFRATSFGSSRFFSTRPEVQLGFRDENLGGLLVVEISPRSHQDAHGENDPLALPQRREDGGSVGRLVHLQDPSMRWPRPS